MSLDNIETFTIECSQEDFDKISLVISYIRTTQVSYDVVNQFYEQSSYYEANLEPPYDDVVFLVDMQSSHVVDVLVTFKGDPVEIRH